MSLLFKTLSSSVIAFLPSSKHLVISWLQSPSAVILEPKKIKVPENKQRLCRERVDGVLDGENSMCPSIKAR